MINVDKPVFLFPALSRGGSEASYANAVSSRLSFGGALRLEPSLELA